MSDRRADELLSKIEEHVVGHGGDLGGWTLHNDGRLKLFDGRITVRAEVEDSGARGVGNVGLHVHVFAILHDHDDEVLDACVMGMGNDECSALEQAATIWVTCVAGPIRSFLDDRPVCMTCRAGTGAADPQGGNVAGDYGIAGLKAFVGPAISRGFDGEGPGTALDDTKPWFRYAAESAAPRSVHLAKSMVMAQPDGRWNCKLETDGHDAVVDDPDWPAGFPARGIGYVMRWAVFGFPPGSSELRRRIELDKAIRSWAAGYGKHETVEALMSSMIASGTDPDVVHEVESLSTIAFGRVFFEGLDLGMRYPATVIRARRDGRIETDVPLLSLPAYARARAVAVELSRTMDRDEFARLAQYNAESNALAQVLNSVSESGGEPDLSRVTLYPCVVPDRGVDDATMAAALALLQRRIDAGRESTKSKAAPPSQEPATPKPWWKFW